MSLSLDDGIDILRVDHAQHPVAEHARCCGLLHDEDQDIKAANTNLYLEMCGHDIHEAARVSKSVSSGYIMKRYFCRVKLL